MCRLFSRVVQQLLPCSVQKRAAFPFAWFPSPVEAGHSTAQQGQRAAQPILVVALSSMSAPLRLASFSKFAISAVLATFSASISFSASACASLSRCSRSMVKNALEVRQDRSETFIPEHQYAYTAFPFVQPWRLPAPPPSTSECPVSSKRPAFCRSFCNLRYVLSN